jgi:hypothetical protein
MFRFLRKHKPQEVSPPARRGSFLSTHAIERGEQFPAVPEVLAGLKKARPAVDGRSAAYAMDDSSDGYPAFKSYGAGQNSVSDALISWYATQGFIGHQLCGVLAQNWLVNKVCTMPGDDAIRKGYNVVSVDGDDLPEEAAKKIKRLDRRFRINWHLREFIHKGRIFGIRIAMFKVDSTDPQYYEKPFNIDGVTAGSYKGIVQIDPYWTAPMLDQAGASQPDSLHFYEPTFWMINGRKVHRSHLIIFRHAEPVDILKPQYLYGGVPLPQQIMERVYAAERTANEAPQLAQTKRTNVWLTDMEAAMSDAGKTAQRLADWAYYRDSYGIKLGDKEGDEYQQFDTSLADFDALIMTQFQLVAAQAGVPATKLLGTQPKGFNSTGEYEEASYHELLESIQEHDLTPFLERHHALLRKAYVPEAAGIDTTVSWNPLDTPTAKELADTNLVKAQTDNQLVQAGAISSEDVRRRVATDKSSGYHELGLEDEEAPGIEDDDGDDDPGGHQEQ